MSSGEMAIKFMWYNFVKVHKTLKVTPRWRRGEPSVGSRGLNRLQPDAQ